MKLKTLAAAAALALLAATSPASAMTQQEAQQHQQQQIAQIYNAGIQAYQSRNYSAAISRMTAVLPYLQDNKNVFIVLGDSFFRLNNMANAERYLMHAYQNFGAREYVVLYDLGTIYFNAEQFQPAAQFLSEATRTNPNAADAWWMLGLSCDNLGNPEGMLNAMTHYISLRPNEKAEAYKLQGLAYRALNDERGAFSSFQNGAQRFPNDPELNFFLGDAYYYVYNRVDLALEHLAKAVNAAPNYFDAHATLGAIYADLYDEGGTTQECDALSKLNQQADVTKQVCKVADKIRNERVMREVQEQEMQRDMERQQQEQMDSTMNQTYSDNAGMDQALNEANQSVFGM